MRKLLLFLVVIMVTGCGVVDDEPDEEHLLIALDEGGVAIITDDVAFSTDILESKPADSECPLDMHHILVIVDNYTTDTMFINPLHFTCVCESSVAYPYSEKTFSILSKPLETMDIPVGAMHMGGLIFEVAPGDKPISLSVETLTHSFTIPFEIEEGRLAP